MSVVQRDILIVVMSLVSLFAFVMSTELGINQTPSLPYKVFLTIKGFPYQKGDLVSIKGHRAHYTGNLSYVKRVEGIGGDQITPLVDLKRETREGKPLTPLTVSAVPEGYVFVRGDHKDSFDSRYEEFGLVLQEHIVGRTFPLW